MKLSVMHMKDLAGQTKHLKEASGYEAEAYSYNHRSEAIKLKMEHWITNLKQPSTKMLSDEV